LRSINWESTIDPRRATVLSPEWGRRILQVNCRRVPAIGKRTTSRGSGFQQSSNEEAPANTSASRNKQNVKVVRRDWPVPPRRLLNSAVPEHGREVLRCEHPGESAEAPRSRRRESRSNGAIHLSMLRIPLIHSSTNIIHYPTGAVLRSRWTRGC